MSSQESRGKPNMKLTRAAVVAETAAAEETQVPATGV